MNRAAAAMLVVLALAACTGGAGGTASATSPSAAASASAGASPGASTSASVAPSSSTPSSSAPSQPAASGSAAAGAACDLLTAAEIEQITGHAVLEQAGGPQMGIFPDGCEWTLEGEMVEPQVVLGLLGPGGRNYYDTYFAPFAEENGEELFEGLGDAALLQDADNVMTVAGDTLLSVQYVDFPLTGHDIAIELTRAVLATLGG